ncbi:MAG TPA: hypothetical protein VLZ83_00835 [Edaphocola sp.]|nr:hypothetical protein [Edaphocola sp.]
MKKTLFLSTIGFLALAIILIACNKDSLINKQNSTSNSNNQLSTMSGGVDILIFSVNLNRNKGKSRDFKPCECRRCGGFCDFVWFPLFKKEASTATIGLQKNSADNIATIFFVAPVDSDLSYNPIYYVDEDVVINNVEDTFHLHSGEYDYTFEEGTFEWEGETFNYHGKIQVPYFN